MNSTLNIVNKTTAQDLQVKGILALPVNNWIIDNDSNVTNNPRIYFDSGTKKRILKAVELLQPHY